MLRNFPWPIRNDILNAPPLDSLTFDDRFELCVLATQKTQLDAVWAAYSFCHMTGRTLKIHFVVDPEPTKYSEELFCTLFPRIDIHSCNVFRNTVSAKALSHFCSTFRFGGKVATIAHLNEYLNILYIDSDVMFFKHPDFMLQSINEKYPFYMIGSGGLAWNSPRLLTYMSNNNIPPIIGFNSGIMYFPNRFVDINLFESALQVFRRKEYDYFTEQTLFNALFSTKCSTSLDRDIYFANGNMHYIYSSDISYSNIVARHFVGPYRHQLYLNGMPLLKAKFMSRQI